jgi:hypothetical protein
LAAKIGLHKFFWNLNEAIDVYRTKIMDATEFDFSVPEREDTNYQPLTFRAQGFKSHKSSKRISSKKLTSVKIDREAEKASLLQ